MSYKENIEILLNKYFPEPTFTIDPLKKTNVYSKLVLVRYVYLFDFWRIIFTLNV